MNTTLLGCIPILLSTALAAQGGGRLIPMNLVQAGDTALDVMILDAKAPPTLKISRDDGAGARSTSTLHTTGEHTRISLQPALVRDEFVSIRIVGGSSEALETYARLYSGDANGDHAVNIADVSGILDYLFGTTTGNPFFPTYADTNGSGTVEIADAIYLLNYLFSSGPAPVAIDSGLGLCALGDQSNGCIQTLIAAMASPNAHVADYAYLRLFDIGDAAVTAILGAAGATPTSQIYPGRACINRTSSIDGPERTRLMSAYLLLIESARRGSPSPFLEFDFFSTGHVRASSQELTGVLNDFIAWDSAFAGVPLAARPRPTLTSPVEFTAQASDTITLPSGFGSVVLGTSLSGVEDASFCTTGDNQFELIWLFEPPFTPGYVAYNCFAWAAGCQSDRWIQPAAGSSLDDFLRDGLGLDPSGASLTPIGNPNEVMITYHRCPDGRVSPVHGTKRDGNKWQAKLGLGPLVRGICNPETFTDLVYPPEPPKVSVHVYYPPL